MARQRRRGNGEGSVYQRTSDGRWTAVLSLPGGKRRAFYGKTRAEALKKLKEAERQQEAGVRVEVDRTTVAGYLDGWFEGKLQLRASTREQYRGHLKHAKARIGGIKLRELNHDDVQGMVAGIARDISPSRAFHVGMTLKSALAGAVKIGKLPRNPAANVEYPEIARREAPTVTAALAGAILAAVKGDKWEAMYVLLLACGLREGEMLGLRWDDVDFDRGRITVRQQVVRLDGVPWFFSPPKTKRGARTVPMPAFVADLLRRQRVEQADLRVLGGTSWQEHGLVFTTMFGTPITDGNFRTRFRWRLKKAGLTGIRPHDLRHGAASLWFAMGVPAKTVSKLLGHANIAITMDLYTHVAEELEREASEAMDRVLSGRIRGDSEPAATRAAVNAAD